MEIISFILTVVVGFAAAGVFSDWLNWPDAGAVFCNSNDRLDHTLEHTP